MLILHDACFVRAYSVKNSHRRKYPWRHCRTRQRSAAQERPPKFGTYRQRVAVSREVARARFAQVVKRALRDARERGMNDAAIAKATGVQPSTFHRWQRGEGAQLPTMDKVRAFFAGLDIPLRPALIALGMEEAREPTPEAPLDPDLKRVARLLADPNVPEATKEAIRLSIRMLSRAARTEHESEPAE